MIGWNYRLIHNEHTGYRVAEVYHDAAGAIVGWSDDSHNILQSWETMDELHTTAEMVLLAFDQPVLTVDDDRLVEWCGDYQRKTD